MGHHDSFGAVWQINNWIQIDFGQTIENISWVEVIKRADVEDRISNVEARIGMRPLPGSFGNLPISTGNSLCGTFLNGTTDPVLWFNCSQPLTGRYLTLQSIIWAFLEVDEIYVHGERLTIAVV